VAEAPSLTVAQSNAVPSKKHMATGTLQVFVAEGLLLPTGILTAAYLTRRLGPESYGVLMLATTIISWISWSITSAFTRTTIKFVGEAVDWRPVASTVLQLHLILGAAAVAGLWLVSESLAIALGEPDMANYLRLFAFEIPFFCLTYAHRSVLVGLGRFDQRAMATGLRWLMRMLLIIALVAAGLSLTGAILGSIGAALLELLVCRYYLPVPLFSRSSFPMQRLWGYAIPLFLLALSLRFYEKLDLFMLKLLGGTAVDAGYYSTAQNLSLAPSLFTLAFVPLLLATLTRTLFAGDLVTAQQLSRNAMRLVLLFLPFAGLLAGSASELMQLVFSSTFLPAAPLFSLLIFAAVAMAMIAVTTSILTAAGKPNWTFVLVSPMVPLAILSDVWIIPKLGTLGAAMVTTGVATIGAVACIGAIYQYWRILPSAASLGRSVLVGVGVYGLATVWSTPSWMLLLKLTIASLLIPCVLLLLGEFSDRERRAMQAYVQSIVHAISNNPWGGR
jgi:O-antigen/teichoic acid export membrane protein